MTSAQLAGALAAARQRKADLERTAERYQSSGCSRAIVARAQRAVAEQERNIQFLAESLGQARRREINMDV